MPVETRHVIVLQKDIDAAKWRWSQRGWTIVRSERIPKIIPPSVRIVIERTK